MKAIVITKKLLHHSIERFGYLCSYRPVTKYKTCYRRKLVCKQRCCSGYQLLNGRCEGNSILHPLCTLICMYPQQVYFRWFWKCHYVIEGAHQLLLLLLLLAGVATQTQHETALLQESCCKRSQHLYYLLGPLLVLSSSFYFFVT